MLLEEIEGELTNPPTVTDAPDPSTNHQRDRATKPMSGRGKSAERSDGPLELSSGERRHLTALAQYRPGRSKVQVAGLTGYNAAGGGFYSYLGALRIARTDQDEG